MHTGILKGDSSEEEGCRRIIEEIDAFIGQCAGKKVSFRSFITNYWVRILAQEKE